MGKLRSTEGAKDANGHSEEQRNTVTRPARAQGNPDKDILNSMFWLTFPPVLSIPLALLTLFLQGTGDRQAYSGASLLLLGSLYLFVSATYTLATMRESALSRFSLQLIAQGIFINIVAQHLGTYAILPWAANATTVVGLILLAGSLIRTPATAAARTSLRNPAEGVAPASGLSIEDIPTPFLSASEDGNVLSANGEMLKLLGKDVSSVVGHPVTDFLPLGEDSVSIQGRQFSMGHRQAGDVFHFSLLERENSGGGAAQRNITVLEIVDPETLLFTKAFGDVRIPEEISRASRYRRWLSSVFFRVEFHSLPGMQPDTARENYFMTEFCKFVKANTRESDLAFFLGNRQVIILLPETPQQGAKAVETKLTQIPEALQQHMESSPSKAVVRHGSCFYSGNYPFSFDQMMQKLYDSLAEND